MHSVGELPQAFVLKCNHGCGYNLICTDKKNYDKIINQDNVWEFVKANRVIHMRGEQDVAEV